MRSPSLLIRAALLFVTTMFVAPIQSLGQSSASGYRYSPPLPFGDGIRVDTLKGARLNETKIATGIDELYGGAFGNIHSILVFRKGLLVLEEYFDGKDETREGSLGTVKHDRDTLHDVRSISKSVVALAVLIAHYQGMIKSLDEPISRHFPKYAHHVDGEKAKITIRHLLTMTAGLEWDENVSYTNPANTAIQMNKAADTIDFVLARKLVAKPGTTFKYNGGLTQLLAAIVQQSTGKNIYQFTQASILAPLGITKHEWSRMETGQPDADSGLRLRSRDLAKIGLLIMNRGIWKGKRIIPARLVDDGVAEQIRLPLAPNAGQMI